MYNNNVPLGGQTLGETQSPIRTNFSLIQQLITQDHYDFNTGNQGKHKFVHLPQTTVPGTAANEGVVYTKDVGGITELFYQRESNGTEIRLTGGTNAANGYAYFGENLLMNWGTGSVTTGGNKGPYTFAKAYSGGNPPYSLVISNEKAGNAVETAALAIQEGTITNVQFELNNRTGQTRTFYYIAIGTAL